MAVRMDPSFTILFIGEDEPEALRVSTALARYEERRFQTRWSRTAALGVRELNAARLHLDSDEGPVSAILVDPRCAGRVDPSIVGTLRSAAPQIPMVILGRPSGETPLQGAPVILLKEPFDERAFPRTLAAILDWATVSKILAAEKHRSQTTLDSLGDAVISTNHQGLVTYLNAVAEQLTGWPIADAVGRPVDEVLQLVDAEKRVPVPNPLTDAARHNRAATLPRACNLVQRTGVEIPIEDSTSPIRDRTGNIDGGVMVFRDVSKARATALQLSYVAQHDGLTDLPNRSLLHDRLERALTAVKRHRAVLAVLFLDLDGFKQVNDALGHAVGDRLLQSVALRLSAAVRETDTVARLGGDEFVILLSEIVHVTDASRFAEKLLEAFRLPFVLDGHELHITASIGVVVPSGNCTRGEDILRHADSAMYEAKQHGRNNYQFYRADLNTRAIERQALEEKLRLALTRSEFVLHYQPIMNVATGELAGAEALIRWQHPVDGLLYPSQFMHVAEESGIIVSIGEWVLREACRQAATWETAGWQNLRIAVNISAVELRSAAFVAKVATTLAETRLAPHRLELELTETYLMQDTKATARVLNALRELGLQLALDDFGTGYSSLSYMRKFPIKTLKVDRSFVRDLTTDPDDASVVSAVINMGKSLNKRVVAEGVETRDQLAFLELHCCTEAQGYFFSRALPANALHEFIARANAPLAGQESFVKGRIC
jgi:diguanylate cyclase (GGDEF)-like protein/PAS domain S-box-containing protein